MIEIIIEWLINVIQTEGRPDRQILVFGTLINIVVTIVLIRNRPQSKPVWHYISGATLFNIVIIPMIMGCYYGGELCILS